MPAVFALGMALLAKSAYQMQTLESNDPKNPQDPPLQGTLRPRSVGRMLPSFPKQSRRMSAAKALSSEFQGPKVLNGCTGFGFRFGFGGGGGVVTQRLQDSRVLPFRGSYWGILYLEAQGT